MTQTQHPQQSTYGQSPQPAYGPSGAGQAAQPRQLSGPFPRADFAQRLGAFAIDLVIIVVAEIVLSMVLGGVVAAVANAGSGAAIGVAALLSLVLVLVYVAVPIVYFGFMEGQPSGQTFGKRALGIRVVDFSSAGPLPMGRAMLRSVVRSFLSGILLLGYLWMLWDPEQQTWHDKLVGTTVVPVSAYPVPTA